MVDAITLIVKVAYSILIILFSILLLIAFMLGISYIWYIVVRFTTGHLFTLMDSGDKGFWIGLGLISIYILLSSKGRN